MAQSQNLGAMEDGTKTQWSLFQSPETSLVKPRLESGGSTWEAWIIRVSLVFNPFEQTEDLLAGAAFLSPVYVSGFSRNWARGHLCLL